MEKKKIIIIDDDEEMSQELKEVLGYEDYEVDTASDGSQGLEMIGKNPYDLIILDLKMPKLNGYEALQRIKEDTPRSKVLVLTGSPINKECLQNGIFNLEGKLDTRLELSDAVLNKPFEVAQMLERVSHLLRLPPP